MKKQLIVSAVLAASLFATAADAGAWRQFGFGSDQKRYNPGETALGADNVGQLQLLWSFQTLDPYAVQSSSAVVSDGIVFIGSVYQHKLLAIHADTGLAHWNRKLDGPQYGAAAIAAGTVYAAAYGTQLYAFNAHSGATVWETSTGGTIANASPVVVSGVVYIGGFDGAMKAFDAGNGAALWSTPTGSAVHASPAVVNGVLYIGTDQLYAMRASDGAVLWTASCGGDCQWSGPAVASGVVYIGGSDGVVRAFDAANGAPKWTYGTAGFIDASPAVANGIVYIGDGGSRLNALRASDGRFLWGQQTGATVSSSAAVANGVVYVGSRDAGLYAFQAKTGALLWSTTLDGPVAASPTVVDGQLFISAGGGRIYAFGLPR